MKTVTRISVLAVLSFLFTACLFKEPVFTEGFAKADASINGVWQAQDDGGDPEKAEHAVCAALDDSRQMIHYPSGTKDGIYYEARTVTARGRTILQIRALASQGEGIPKAGSEIYTLLWIEKEEEGKRLRVRALKGEAAKDSTPEKVHKALEDKFCDWNSLFGDPQVFNRVK